MTSPMIGGTLYILNFCKNLDFSISLMLLQLLHAIFYGSSNSGSSRQNFVKWNLAASYKTLLNCRFYSVMHYRPVQ